MDHPDTVFQSAVRAFETRDWPRAEALCRQALLANPRHENALHMLGLVCGETGRHDEAISILQAAIAENPQSAALWSNLAILCREAGKVNESMECARQAIALHDGMPEAHYNLSLALQTLGQLEAATQAARRSVELRPAYAEAQYQLGNLLLEQGRLAEAIAAFECALRQRPHWSEPRYYLGLALMELRRPEEAIRLFREILQSDPACISAAHSMGQALYTLGRVEEARSAFQYVDDAKTAHGQAVDPMSALFRETLAELVPCNVAAIEDYKSRVSAALARYAARPGKLDLSTLHTDAAVPSIMLPYYGGNLRPLMEQYAAAIGPWIPQVSRAKHSGKPRLGIVVTSGHERVFARCWGGIAERLSRELFDIKLVCSRAGANLLQTLLNLPRDEFLALPAPVDEAAALLTRCSFDWLHYWEIATDAVNYYLPFFRPAAAQSTGWGWPLTSGNPQVHAYLSCEQLEPADGSTHYSEQLILLKRLPVFYRRSDLQSSLVRRTDLGMDDTQRLYLCTQNIRKYHPDFDAVLANLLRTDVEGALMIVGDAQPSITEMLLQRFLATMPDVVHRVRVVPFMQRPQYLGLVATADVCLDTLHYGAGANTLYDAVAMGTPVITLPGEFHRGRWATAVNRRLGLPEVIADSPEQYVRKAVEVANDSDLRQSLRRQILTAGGELFEDMETVHEHEEYFAQAIAALRAV